jgi:hypothetical protein
MMNRMSSNLMCILLLVGKILLAEKLGKKHHFWLRSAPPLTQHDLQGQYEPQMTLNYHQLDPLGDDNQDK